MRNSEKWKATKYEFRNGRLRGTKNGMHLTRSSRLITDLTAAYYQKYVPLYATGQLVDLGCGHAPFYVLYKAYVKEVTCVDWANTMHQNEFLDLTCDLNKPLPIEDDSFDTIIISEVLEHISNPTLIWKEMTRILKCGGRILLSVPFLYKIHEAPFDYYRYTEFALKEYASNNQLKVLELHTCGGLPEVLTDMFAKNITKLPLIGKGLAALAQSLCFWFVQAGLGKKFSQRSGKAYPIGYFMVVEKPLTNS